MDSRALQLSLTLAALTVAALLILGLPLAYFLAMTSSRWRAVLNSVVTLPLVLPPTVVGFYLLTALGPRSWTGRLAESLLGHSVAFSFAGLLIASILVNLPFAVRPFVAAFSGVPRNLIEAAQSLGDSPIAAFFRVVLPLSWPGVLGGCVLTFVHTMGEFGVALMVGGAIPGKTATLSIDLYNSVQAMDYAAAHTTALVLVAAAFIGLCCVFWMEKRVER